MNVDLTVSIQVHLQLFFGGDHHGRPDHPVYKYDSTQTRAKAGHEHATSKCVFPCTVTVQAISSRHHTSRYTCQNVTFLQMRPVENKYARYHHQQSSSNPRIETDFRSIDMNVIIIPVTLPHHEEETAKTVYNKDRKCFRHFLDIVNVIKCNTVCLFCFG